MSATTSSYLKNKAGTSQHQRALDAMKEDYVRIDENDFEHWIVFASEFARYIRFIEVNGQTAGDWEPFFNDDIAARLSLLAIQDVAEYKRLVALRFELIGERDASPGEARVHLHELFSIILSLSKAFDHALLVLPETSSTSHLLTGLVKNKLRTSLRSLLAYYKGAVSLNLMAGNLSDAMVVLNRPVRSIKEILQEGLSAVWQTDSSTGWEDYLNAIVEDQTVFSVAGTDLQKIQHAALHNLFTGLFHQFLQAFSSIVREARLNLLQVLKSYDDHPPHYALFLTFLRLFVNARDQLNGLRKSHLDFYYKDVLRFRQKPAQPGKAHITIELARHIEQYLLRKNVEFKAGKDKQGRDIVFRTDRDWIINKASIAGLRSIFVAAGDGSDNTTSIDNRYRVFASPVSNSKDGISDELQAEWHPFASKTYQDGVLQYINMPPAQIGFAISSKYLYLQEGSRTIKIKIESSSFTQLNGVSFHYWLTTEKGWFEVPSAQVQLITSGSFDDTGTNNSAEFSFQLSADDPAVAGFDGEVHGQGFPTGVPVLRLLLANDAATPYSYASLRQLTVSRIRVSVDVGDSSAYSTSGVKNLQVIGVAGPVDISKPFQPFGARPEKDEVMIIGNREIFTKKNVQLSLHFEWAKLPGNANNIRYTAVSDTTADSPKIKSQFLENGVWKDDDEYFIFDGIDPTVKVSLLGYLPSGSVADFDLPYEPYSSATRKGFTRFVLKDHFGFKLYMSDLTLHLVKSAKEDTPAAFAGVEPYSPTIQSLYASYSATDAVPIGSGYNDLSDPALRFYHIEPFAITDQTTTSSSKLLPQFTWPQGTVNDASGELHIGLANLRFGDSVSILFQVVEGSTNPEVQKPEEHITWSYFSSGRWIEFDEGQISDTTRQLLQSGIVQFFFPSPSENLVQLKPDDLMWIKADVKSSVEAVGKLNGIDTQGVLLSMHEIGNSADAYEMPLPVGSISKLRVPDAAVKKIVQPYSSFGHKPAETSPHFYIRVSERLRHKSRAVTAWDYEHLVLEAFPDIHKVKCLSHTRITDSEYEEDRPGYVSVITLPDLKNRSEVNPLRPYTNANRLEEIREFLKQKVSCHVNVLVANPQFEEIRLEFKLSLYTAYADFNFYSEQLKQEITGFLTPWAVSESPDIEFGGKIYKSSLINFIEERPYVDFITDVKLIHLINSSEVSDTLEEITASTARSILVSAPAGEHVITNYNT